MQEKISLGAIKSLLLNALRILKDEEYQRRVWFHAEGSEVSSYIDTALYLIDKCESFMKDPQFEDYLGKENYALLHKLYNQVNEHVSLTEDRINVDELQEHELLDDPNWHDIQSLSEEVYKRLTDFVKRHENE